MAPREGQTKDRRIMVRVSEQMYEELVKIAAEESAARRADLSIAWVIRLFAEDGIIARRAAKSVEYDKTHEAGSQITTYEERTL